MPTIAHARAIAGTTLIHFMLVLLSFILLRMQGPDASGDGREYTLRLLAGDGKPRQNVTFSEGQARVNQFEFKRVNFDPQCRTTAPVHGRRVVAARLAGRRGRGVAGCRQPATAGAAIAVARPNPHHY